MPLFLLSNPNPLKKTIPLSVFLGSYLLSYTSPALFQSMDGSGWLNDYSYMDDESVAVSDFVYPCSDGFNCWQSPFESFSEASVEVNYSFGESESSKGSAGAGTPRKRLKSSESFNASSSSGTKAVREKIRRDRLNERFIELSSVLEPGKPPSRMDKVVLLNDAVRTVIHLRDETQKLKKSICRLEEKIKDLKVEKNELRDENQKLKTEKERMEEQFKAMSIHPSALSAANKTVPCIDYRYPGVAMWQYLPQAVVDTSRDHILRPPVA